MNPKNFRKGRSTKKLHEPVPSSNMQERSPAQAKFIERVHKEAAVIPGCVFRNKKALAPPTKSGPASRATCNRRTDGLRTQMAKRAPMASPSRLHQVWSEIRSRETRSNTKMPALSNGVTAQVAMIRTTWQRLENFRTIAGQSM